MVNLLKGVSVSFLVRICGAGVSFLFNVALAKLTGPEGAGAFFIALTVATTMSVFGDLGFPKSVLRFTSVYIEKNDLGSLKGMYQLSLTVTFLGSLFATLIALFFAPLIADSFFKNKDLILPIGIISFSIIPYSILTLHLHLLQGINCIFEYTSLQAPGLFFSFISIIFLFIFNSFNIDSSAVYSYLISTIINASISVYLWRKKSPNMQQYHRKFNAKDLFRSSTPLFWVRFTNLIMGKASTTLILGYFLPTRDVGIYNLAYRTSSLLTIVLGAVNNVVAPRFASLYQRKDFMKLSKVAKDSALLTTLTSLPLLFPLIFFPDFILQMFGKDEFSSGSSVLVILAIGQFVCAATGSVDFLLIMSGNEKYVRNNNIAASIGNLILNIAIVPFWGISGAAISDSLTLIFQNLVSTFWVNKKLGFFPMPMLIFRHSSKK